MIGDSIAPLPPLEVPPVFTRAHEQYIEERELAGGRPTADGTRGRGSKAHHCGRQLALEDMAVAPDKPDGDWNVLAFKYGQYGHDITQAALVKHFSARVEVPVSWKPAHEMSGHVDAVYDRSAVNDTAVEIKTMKEWGFLVATGQRESRDPVAAGPKPEHLTQVGMYALAPQLEASAVHMIYLNKNTGDAAEWIIPVDQPLAHLPGNPTVEKLAVDELARLDTIFADVDSGVIPERRIPGVGRVEKVDGRAAPWQCRYCAYQATCSALPAGPVSVEVILGRTTAAAESTPTPAPEPVLATVGGRTLW